MIAAQPGCSAVESAAGGEIRTFGVGADNETFTGKNDRADGAQIPPADGVD
ncbi:MAG TPA: hypothetical protein VGN81_23840 [Pseudonocardiaceae bacterium]